MTSDNIVYPREKWVIRNNSASDIYIYDVPDLPVLKRKGHPKDSYDALSYTTSARLQSSINYRNYVNNGLVVSDGFLHTHDDKSNVGHTHLLTSITDITASSNQINQLSNKSNADDLHSHFHNNLSDLNKGDYQHLTSLEKAKFIKLTDGSSADDLHNHELNIDHNGLENIQGGKFNEYYHLNSSQYINTVGITATFVEINQALNGIGSTVVYSNLNVLTNGSNADSLHSHSGTGSEHNNLLGLQGGENGKYYHLTEEENNLVNRLGEDSSGLTFDEISLLDSLWRRSGTTLFTASGGDGLNLLEGNLTFDTGNIVNVESIKLLSSVDDPYWIIGDGVNFYIRTDGHTFYTNAGIFIVQNSGRTEQGALSPENVTTKRGIFKEDDGNAQLRLSYGSVGEPLTASDFTVNANGNLIITTLGGDISFDNNNLTTTGNININSNTSKLYFGEGQDANIGFDGTDLVISVGENPSLSSIIKLNDDVEILGNITINNIPTSDPGVSGAVWRDGTDLKVSI